MDDESVRLLGPLGPLVGTWEGVKGQDVAPDDDRGIENNAYHERMTFAPTGLVSNHDQKLYGLRYATTVWRLGAEDPFHEELGYWLWDPGAQQVMRCFLIPRGVALIAGGSAASDARTLKMSAELGSPTFGICSNPFLDREFKTVKYDLTVTIGDDGTLSYQEDTQLQMKGRDELFHHTDENTLQRVN